MAKSTFAHLVETIVATVPQWYWADTGRFAWNLRADGESATFYTTRWLTPQLKELFDWISENLEGWCNAVGGTVTQRALNRASQLVAKRWLESVRPDVQWQKLLDYAEGLQYRSYENQTIAINLVVAPSGGVGSIEIVDADLQKILDPLAGSPRSYLRVDGDLRFLNYQEILWSEVTDTKEYKFHPEFMQPFAGVLKDGEVSVHVNQRNDLIILSSEGLLASSRRGRWHVYDVQTFKNMVADAVGDYRVGCNLFEVLFDLSYKRHGALMIYDPAGTVREHVVNRSSLFASPAGVRDAARTMFQDSVGSIEMGATEFHKRKKSLLLEIASLDGAVVFDKRSILAFGAMIETHPQVGSHHGARTTAAQSAYLWGGKPIKVSSDGDITMIFTSKNEEKTESCKAEVTFM